jgi:hypothetical protein
LTGATRFLVKHYLPHDIYAGDKFGPEEEHEAYAAESEHEHDTDNQGMQHEHVEGIAEETFMPPSS